MQTTRRSFLGRISGALALAVGAKSGAEKPVDPQDHGAVADSPQPTGYLQVWMNGVEYFIPVFD